MTFSSLYNRCIAFVCRNDINMEHSQCSVQYFFCEDRETTQSINFSYCKNLFQQLINFYQQGKMILFFISLIMICEYTMTDIDLGNVELPNNILKFGYGINYKYMGKVSHSFDRFYIVTKFELPKIENLQFDDIPYDVECALLDDPKPGQILGIIRDIKCYCVKIAPHIDY